MFYEKTGWLRSTFSTADLIARIKLWQHILILLKGKAAIIIGLGEGSRFKMYTVHYGNSVAIAHNSYLQLYCDTDILGFIAMVLGAIIIIYRTCLS
jgi:O-antigen ligase